MDGENLRQYWAWLLYCEMESVNKMLCKWKEIQADKSKAPESLKGIEEKIRKALENATYLTDDSQMIENLKTCLAFLEGFIDDEEANKKNASLLKILKK